MAETSTNVDLSDYYWWHKSVLRELLRLENLAEPQVGYSAAGIAGNCDFLPNDGLRYCTQLEDMGLVERAVPTFETRYPWFQLTAAGRELVAK